MYLFIFFILSSCFNNDNKNISIEKINSDTDVHEFDHTSFILNENSFEIRSRRYPAIKKWWDKFVKWFWKGYYK